ncbi:MAG TPA: hypothetical protein PKH92_05745 [Anaerolineaceae bacterium]|nr:hypothetical protein [Anaerolineaceae bacterium]
MADLTRRRRFLWSLIILALAVLACNLPAAAPPTTLPTTTIQPSISLPTDLPTVAPLTTQLPTATAPMVIQPTPTRFGIQVATPTLPPVQPTGEALFTPFATLPQPTLATPPSTEIQPALPEQRLLSLEWPSRLRVGDSDIVKLTLEVDASGNITPTAEIGGHEITGQPVFIPNLYDTHDLVLESRLDLAGIQVEPSGSLSSPLQPGTTVTFYWSLSADHPGTYRGTLWVYLNLIPRNGGPSQQQVLLGKRLDIEAQNLLGLTGGAARTTGVIGAVFGFILNIPFLEDIIKFFARRLRRR